MFQSHGFQDEFYLLESTLRVGGKHKCWGGRQALQAPEPYRADYSTRSAIAQDPIFPMGSPASTQPDAELASWTAASAEPG